MFYICIYMSIFYNIVITNYIIQNRVFACVYRNLYDHIIKVAIIRQFIAYMCISISMIMMIV